MILSACKTPKPQETPWNELTFGYIDKTGEVVIAPVFERGWAFHEGLANVKIDGRYGYIDRGGEWVIEPRYEFAGPFHEGMVVIGKDLKFGYIDKAGEVVVEPIYDSAGSFRNGYAAIEVERKVGFIDRSGKVIIKPYYDNDDAFVSEGLICVKKDGKWGYIDTDGNVVIDFVYDHAEPFFDGWAYVQIDGSGGWFINKEFEQLDVDAVSFDEPRGLTLFFARVGTAHYSLMSDDYEFVFFAMIYVGFFDGIAGVSNPKNGKYGLIDTNGDVVVDFKYDFIQPFSDGIASAELEEGGVSYMVGISTDGREVFRTTDRIGDFKNGVAVLIGKDSEDKSVYGAINKEGEVIIPPVYDMVYDSEDGMILVKDNGRYGYFDTAGNQITDISFEFGSSFSEGLALVGFPPARKRR